MNVRLVGQSPLTMAFLLAVLAILAVILPAGIVHAMTARSAGSPAKNNKSGPCYVLDGVEIASGGYVTLSFGPTGGFSTYNCNNEIYFAASRPEGKIRGVSGLNGNQVKGKFKLTVEPDTAGIYLEMSGYGGNLSQRYFEVSNFLAAAKREKSGWQTAWKHSEQTLQEQATKDKSPPKILLVSPDVTPKTKVFRVDTYQVFIRGKVRDNSGVGQVLVNGRRTRVSEDGSFAKKIRLALGTNHIKVEAEDIHGNVSARDFAIVREDFIPNDNLADIDLPPRTNISKPDALGVVIGIESYQYVPAATYAYNDAEVVREYLAQTLGFSKERVKLVTNTKATQAEFDRLLGAGGWLARNVVKGKSDVIVYFSGHGIPEVESGQVGLLPFDVDPNYSIGFALDKLYRNLGSLGARSVTVFLDTCFSGQSREKKLLLANARGIVVAPKQTGIPKGISVMTAATSSQISGPLKKMEHGLFTYYLLKGLGGKADANKNGGITVGELASFTSREVKRHAAKLGWEQTPEMLGLQNVTILGK
jgi:hypothetical protein